MAYTSLKCNGTISFVYVKSGGRIMQISGRSDSLCIFLYEMDFNFRFQPNLIRLAKVFVNSFPYNRYKV